MTRHEMKQDDLVTAVERARGWAQKNPILFRNGAIGAAAVLVVVLGAIYVFRSRAASAAELLRQGQARFSAQIGTPGADPSVTTSYPTEVERDRASLELFDRLVSQYGGRVEGRLARYYQGLLLARLGRPLEAEAALESFVKSPSSPVLAGLARAQLGQLETQKGDLERAAKVYSDLAADTNGSYPRDWALYYFAQTLDQQGKRTEAVETYRKIVSEFPSSPMASEASRKIEGAPAAP